MDRRHSRNQRRTCHRRSRSRIAQDYEPELNTRNTGTSSININQAASSLLHDLKTISIRKLTENASSALIALSLISLVFLILQYNCYLHNSNNQWMNLAQNIDDVSENLLQAKLSYYDLEKQVENVSLELPKIKSQFELLEMLAQSGDNKNYSAKPKTW